MSWLELDDRILEHPKFIRAVKLAGSEAVHLWLGLRAYCGQLLTDGFVPEDMFDEVRGPSNAKKRSAAFDALKAVNLLDPVEGGVQMHNYLKWSKSRDQIERERVMARDRKARSRGGHAVTDTVTPSVTHAVTNTVTPGSVTRPHARGRAPLLSTPLHSSPEIPPTPQPPTDGANTPTSLTEALAVPLQRRAQLVTANPYSAEWLQPQCWPEVAQVVSALHVASGLSEPRLGRYERDSAVRQAVALFEAGMTVQGLLDAIPRIVASPWWREKRRDFGALTLTVLRRSEPDEEHHGQIDDVDAEARRKAARAARVVAERATQAIRERLTAELQGSANGIPEDCPRSVADLVEGIGK